MSFIVNRTFSLSYPNQFTDAINADPGITHVCEYVRVDFPDSVSMSFTGTGPLSGAEETALDILIANFVGVPEAEDTNNSKFLAHNGPIVQNLSNNFVTALFNTIVRQDGIFSYSSGTVTVNKDTWCTIKCDISSTSTATSATTEIRILHNGTPLSGSTAYGFHRNSSTGKLTTTTGYIIGVSSGDTITIQIREADGSVATIAESCRLLIEETNGPV